MTETTRPLVAGCCVRPRDLPPGSAPWLVVEDVGGAALVWIESSQGGPRREVPRDQLVAAFLRGMHVEDSPRSAGARRVGRGTVMASRRLGGREQVLVEFHESGQLLWMPFELLRHVWDPAAAFAWQTPPRGSADRFRLRVLAHALGQWQANTGALATLDVDPLPHQIQLVHDILASGNLNWLIADDVGLGKTIEVGLLLHALQARSTQPQRVLIVCPAGLTRQWRDALTRRFRMDDFRIYGEDFTLADPSRFPLYPRMIASLDKLKRDPHLSLFRASGRWDIIIFDEGHRLTRKASAAGLRFTSSQRFRLAAELRAHTDALMLLTATPHQGDTSLFGSLLELLRPEWKELIGHLSHTPELVRDVVYRNRKSQVIDMAGDNLFEGHTAALVECPGEAAELRMTSSLLEYLRRGYKAAADDGTPRARAIGFVMTVYRKLAASSMAALREALTRRHARLKERAETEGVVSLSPVASEGSPWLNNERDEEDDGFITAEDDRFAVEAEVEALDDPRTDASFFESELKALEQLISLADSAVEADGKHAAFIGRLLPALMRSDGPEPNRVLIFTEYRVTLELLVRSLGEAHGTDRVVAIHGGLDTDARLEAEGAFTRGGAWFLVSTEAGGEGLNLHHACHTVVNYDLPWNPMRLVQRIGRVYRYGQRRQVRVYNLFGTSSLDNSVVVEMYRRLEQVVEDLAGLGGEFHPRLHEEILGEIAGLLDVEHVIASSFDDSPRRTRERLDDALTRAERARQLQQEVLAHARGFSRDRFEAELRLDRRHLEALVHGVLLAEGATFEGRAASGTVGIWRLSNELMRLLGAPRPTLRLAFDPEIRLPNVTVLAWEHPLVRRLVRQALAPEFGGEYATLSGLPGESLTLARLRWQNDQGRRQHEELVALCLPADADEPPLVNPPALASWLLKPAQDAETRLDQKQRGGHLSRAERALESRLADGCGAWLGPQQVTLLGVAELTREP